ncbi:hypothetical protein G9A89_016473 [Geosiphon pyriformis]|nr:hypothetical protein G9A89_016473 [Geosiphon pyriformis]
MISHAFKNFLNEEPFSSQRKFSSIEPTLTIYKEQEELQGVLKSFDDSKVLSAEKDLTQMNSDSIFQDTSIITKNIENDYSDISYLPENQSINIKPGSDKILKKEEDILGNTRREFTIEDWKNLFELIVNFGKNAFKPSLVNDVQTLWKIRKYAEYAGYIYCLKEEIISLSNRVDVQIDVEDINSINVVFRGNNKDLPNLFKNNRQTFYITWKGRRVQDAMIHREIYKEFLWIRGSLGGVFAVLSALSFKEAYPEREVTVYTYGQPRIGNVEFANYVDSVFSKKYNPNIYRMTKLSDKLPLIPERERNYKHHSEEFFLNGKETYRCISTSVKENENCVNSYKFQTTSQGSLQINNVLNDQINEYYGVPMGSCIT